MFSTKEINGKSYVVYEDFIYDEETMEWILIDEFEYIICRKSQVVQHHLIETASSYHRGSKETSTMVEE